MRSIMPQTILTLYAPADPDAAIAAYLAGASIITMARELDVAQGTFAAFLTRRGVHRRGRADAQRVHSLREDYFDAITDEARAYWLGFLAADGGVSDRGDIVVGLAACDAGHLYKFRAALETSYPIRLGVTRSAFGDFPNARLDIRSPRLAAALARLGVAPRKSLTGAPSPVPPELARHYWRGVFDGDGGIEHPKRPGRWILSMVGSQAMVDGFAAFAKGLYPTRASVRPMKRIYRFSLACRAAAVVLGALYDGATVALDRKVAAVESMRSEREAVGPSGWRKGHRRLA